jgi:hypothetical protein
LRPRKPDRAVESQAEHTVSADASFISSVYPSRLTRTSSEYRAFNGERRKRVGNPIADEHAIGQHRRRRDGQCARDHFEQLRMQEGFAAVK